MKRGLIILAVVGSLVAVGALAAFVVSAAGPSSCGVDSLRLMGRSADAGTCSTGRGGARFAHPMGGGATCGGSVAVGAVETIQDAENAFEAYLTQGSYDGLAVTEVMRFVRNDYAIVAETDTGIGAFELLLDRASGVVSPEPGPNMMWNVKYGMHGRMRGGVAGMGMWRGSINANSKSVDAEQASQIAQSWLDDNLPGRQAGTPDAFYGYYTLHYLLDGQVDGMLSVNAATGQVWQHTWHGAFVQMTEHAD